jgi:IS5 family transposase
VALIQESLAVAHKTGALAPLDLERVVVDTTVEPKAIAHPSDARLCHRALQKLVDLAKRNHVVLRQSYVRLAKRAAIMVGRYTHAHQFKRARRELKFLRTRLGRVIRDIRRKIAGNPALSERFAELLGLAARVRFQDHRQRGPKVYALHAPEVECIGKGKARAPYEFGCKVSIATPATKPKSLPSRKRGAASLCCTPRPCTATRLTATPWVRWSPSWSSSPGSRPAASMSTRATAATTIGTNSGSGSPVRCGG